MSSGGSKVVDGYYHPGKRVHKGGCVGSCCDCQGPCGGSCSFGGSCDGDCEWTCCSKKGRKSSWPGCAKAPSPSATLTISNHPHVLNYTQNLRLHSCDLCQQPVVDGYRCSDGCDFDVCLKCATSLCSPAASSKKAQKIAVGSKVELTSDYAAHSDAGNGPLKPGHKFLRSPLRGVLLCFIRTGADVV